MSYKTRKRVILAKIDPVLVLTRKAGATLTKYQAITAAGAVVAAGELDAARR